MLKVPHEPCWRLLECNLLEPSEEGSANQPLTEKQLADLFSIEPGVAIAEPEQEELPAEVPSDDDAAMEAQNLIHDVGPDQHDGADLAQDDECLALQDTLMLDGQQEEETWEEARQIAEEAIPILPGMDPILLNPDEYSDDEALSFTPADAQSTGNMQYDHPEVAEVQVHSSTASSSKGKMGSHGLNITPLEARSRLPQRAGAKVQHRRSKVTSQSSGWQAWVPWFLISFWYSWRVPCLQPCAIFWAWSPKQLYDHVLRVYNSFFWWFTE